MRRLQRYLQQSWAELEKVVWPNRPAAVRLTLAVVGFSLALAVIIGVLDAIYTYGLQTLILKG